MARYSAEQMREYMNHRRAKIRAEMVAFLGGRCVECGVEEGLEFDHIDPSTKLFAIASGLDRPRAELLAEVRKCQLLCTGHHKEKSRLESQGRRVPEEKQAKGERHGRAKLTDDDVRWIRSSGLSTDALAGIYGMSRSTIRCARSGRTWKHVA